MLKRFLAAVFFLFFFAAPSFAQLAINIKLNQGAYLQYEPVYARVTVRNLSGHMIAFGERPELSGKFKFDIYPIGANAQKLDMRKKNTEGMSEERKAFLSILPDMHGVILPAGSTQTFTFRLTDYYDLRKLGAYNVKAVISHAQLGTAYESNAVNFRVTTGVKIWGPVTVGIPDTGTAEKTDSKAKIKTRNYSVVSYYSGRDTSYALVIDDKDNNYMVKRIGRDLGATLRPMCLIDFLSRLNILVAASPSVYAYYQFNTDGELEKKQVYIKTSTTPMLIRDKETGIVMPAGGRVARKDKDYEELKELPFMEDLFGNSRKPVMLDPEDDEGFVLPPKKEELPSYLPPGPEGRK